MLVTRVSSTWGRRVSPCATALWQAWHTTRTLIVVSLVSVAVVLPIAHIQSETERICAARERLYYQLNPYERDMVFPYGPECTGTEPFQPALWRIDWELRKLHWGRLAMLLEVR